MQPAGSAAPTRSPPCCTGTAPIRSTSRCRATRPCLALRAANALLSIDVNGDSQLALPKQVQRDPLRHTIEHVDLVIVRRGEKVTVDIPLLIEGEAARETLVVVDQNTISVEAEATHIPQQITVSIEGLAAGTQILARDLQPARRLDARDRPGGARRQHHRRPRPRPRPRPSWPRPRPRPASSRPWPRTPRAKPPAARPPRRRGRRAVLSLRATVTHVRLARGRAR